MSNSLAENVVVYEGLNTIGTATLVLIDVDPATGGSRTYCNFWLRAAKTFRKHLLLNKRLCGIEQAQPLARALPLTPEEEPTG